MERDHDLNAFFKVAGRVCEAAGSASKAAGWASQAAGRYYQRHAFENRVNITILHSTVNTPYKVMPSVRLLVPPKCFRPLLDCHFCSIPKHCLVSSNYKKVQLIVKAGPRTVTVSDTLALL